MAFGMFSPDPNDSFDTGKVVGTGAQKRAQDFLNKYIETDIVGGAGVDTFGQMRYKEILGDAQQSAQSTTNTAGAISGGLDLLGSVGSFGAAGGFGNFGGGGSGKLLEDPTATFKNLNPGEKVYDMQVFP